MEQKKNDSITSTQADHLEVYPERKQVSAFPERRFIKTNRMLSIVTLVNLACIIAGASLFAYTAQKVDVKVTVPSHVLLYQMDTEEKMLKPSEYMEIRTSSQRFILENYLRRYITELHSVSNNVDDMLQRTSDKGFVATSSDPNANQVVQKIFTNSLRTVLNNGKIRDVHIYNLHPYHNNFWTAVIETFDFPNTGDLERVCNCFDNSTQCLTCKAQRNVGRERRRIWIRTSFRNKKTPENLEDNPFGILISGYYIGYTPLVPKSLIWDLPPELKPDL